MLFFNQTGLERVGVVGPEPGLLLDWSAGSGCGTAGLQALDVAPLVCRLWMWLSSTKTRKKVGRRGLRPWPLRCLSQFLSERKDRLFRGLMFLHTFHRWGGLIFIVYIIPNWRVIKILSHWMGYFLPLSDFNKEH